MPVFSSAFASSSRAAGSANAIKTAVTLHRVGFYANTATATSRGVVAAPLAINSRSPSHQRYHSSIHSSSYSSTSLSRSSVVFSRHYHHQSSSGLSFAHRHRSKYPALPLTPPAFRSTAAFLSTMVSPTVKLSSGHEMPQVGFGLWKVENAVCADIVYNAIKEGYRYVCPSLLLSRCCSIYLSPQLPIFPSIDHTYLRT
jgi:hypothetical protein